MLVGVHTKVFALRAYSAISGLITKYVAYLIRCTVC